MIVLLIVFQSLTFKHQHPRHVKKENSVKMMRIVRGIAQTMPGRRFMSTGRTKSFRI